MIRNQKGFGAIEILLLIAIIGLVSGLGFYLYHQNQSKNPTNSSHNTTTNSPTTQRSATDSPASKLVVEFYDKYAKLDPPGNPTAEETLLKQYGTDTLLSYFKANQNGVDPIVCAQAIPDSFKVTNSTVNQNTTTVTVNETFGNDKVSITATVIDQNGLKIDSLNCPATLLPGGDSGP